jgi:hypothetical protein
LRVGRVRKIGAALLPWLLPGAAVLLLLGALAVLAAQYLHGYGAISADDFLCVSLCQDVLDGRSLDGWHLPGAPYLFPDDLLLLGCQALTADVGLAFTLYLALFYLALLACLAWLGRLAGLPGRRAFLVACAGPLLLIAAHLGEAYRDRARLMGHPGNHAGAILVGVLVLALVLRGLRRGHGLPGAAALVLAVGLGTFSDKLLALQFLAPAGAALVALALRRAAPWRRVALTLALLAAGAGLALGAQALAGRLGAVVLREEDQVRWFRPVEWGPAVALLTSFVEGQTLLCWLWPLHLAVALGLALFWRRGAPGRREAVLFLALFLLLLPACNVGALLATGKIEKDVARYLLASFFAPFLFLGPLLAAVPGRAARRAGALFVAAALLFAGWRVGERGPVALRQGWRAPYPPLAQALDQLVRERGRLRGLGSYWAARGMKFLSRERVLVNSFMTYPFVHGDNPDRFLAEALDDADVPEFRFVVVDAHLRAEHVLVAFGEAAEHLPAGDAEVWLYDRPLANGLFTRFLQAQAARRYRRAHAWTAPVWPTSLGRPRRAFSPADAHGNLRLGPGSGVEVRFDPPVTGTLIDLGADHADRYELAFFAGAEHLATLRAPNVPWTGTVPPYGEPGTQPRLLPLPPVLCQRPWDRVVVTTRYGFGTEVYFSLAHFLVYHDAPPRLAPPPAPAAPRRFEAEAPPMAASPGARRVADPSASGGAARRGGPDFAGCLSFGPYLTLPAGRYRVDFAVKVDDTAAPGRVATLEVTSGAGPRPLARRDLGAADFPAPGRYDCHSLTFETEDELAGIEFRLLAAGGTGLTLDYVELTALPPSPEDAR